MKPARGGEPFTEKDPGLCFHPLGSTLLDLAEFVVVTQAVVQTAGSSIFSHALPVEAPDRWDRLENRPWMEYLEP